MLLIKGVRNDFTGKTTWEKEPVEISELDGVKETRSFATKTIYYMNDFWYGKQSKNNPLSAGDRMQRLYKEVK